MRAAALQGTARWHCCPAFGADALGSLADDFDEFGQCEPEELVMIEVTALPAVAVADRLGRGLVQVAQPDAVVRPHTAGGRWR
jgi:hypothetical protein